jgi:hypothetical protein
MYKEKRDDGENIREVRCKYVSWMEVTHDRPHVVQAVCDIGGNAPVPLQREASTRPSEMENIFVHFSAYLRHYQQILSSFCGKK